MTGSDLRRRWRQYKADQEQKGGAEVDIRVALAGSMTVEPLEPYLGAQLLRRNFKPSIIAGPFNQLRQICSDPRSTLGRDDINVIVLLWRIEDLFPDMLMHCLRFPGTLSDLLQEVRELVDAVSKLRKSFTGTLIVSTPPYPSVPGFNLLELGQESSGISIFNTISQFWTEQIGKLERVRLLGLQGLLLKVGIDAGPGRSASGCYIVNPTRNISGSKRAGCSHA